MIAPSSSLIKSPAEIPWLLILSVNIPLLGLYVASSGSSTLSVPTDLMLIDLYNMGQLYVGMFDYQHPEYM